MDKEREFIITAIKDHISGNKTVDFSDLDWEKVYSYSCSHEICPIIFSQSSEFMPENIRHGFEEKTAQAVFMNVNRKALTEKVMNALKENGVAFALVKGPVIADFYPVPQYRTMGDVDISVDSVEKARKALLSIGMKEESSLPYESTFSYGDFTYEIHPGLVYRNENEVNLIREEKFFNAFREKTKDGKLDDAFHFLYVLQHVKGHFAYAGVGIRQFTDIAVLIRNDNGIDWEKVKKGLEETGLSDFAFASFFFIEKAFGIKAPISYPERDDDFFERSKDVIFRNGVFGFDNENNEAVFVSTIMRLENVGYKKAKFKNFMNQAFPGYDAMKGLYYVPYLNNRKFLLPIAWIHRFFYRSFCGKNRREFIKNTMVPKKTVEAKGAFLKEWGIQS